MGWVDPWVGLGWVEIFLDIWWVGLGRGSETFRRILKLLVGLYIMYVICIKVIPDKFSLTVIYALWVVG